MHDSPSNDSGKAVQQLTTVNRQLIMVFAVAFVALMGLGTPHIIRVTYTSLSVALSVYVVLRWLPRKTLRGMWVQSYACSLLLAVAGPVIDLTMTYYGGYAIAPVCWAQLEANVGLVRAVSARGYAGAAATSVIEELGVLFFPSAVALCVYGAWRRRRGVTPMAPLFFIVPLTIGFYLLFGHVLLGGLTWLLNPCTP